MAAALNFIRKYWYWAIPIVLALTVPSFFIGIDRLFDGHRPGAAIAFQQYMAFFAFLLLGEWAFRFGWFDRLFCIGIGFLGIGCACAILVLFLGKVPYIYLWCVAGQVLWLLRVTFTKRHVSEPPAIACQHRGEAALACLFDGSVVRLLNLGSGTMSLFGLIILPISGWALLWLSVAVHRVIAFEAAGLGLMNMELVKNLLFLLQCQFLLVGGYMLVPARTILLFVSDPKPSHRVGRTILFGYVMGITACVLPLMRFAIEGPSFVVWVGGTEAIAWSLLCIILWHCLRRQARSIEASGMFGYEGDGSDPGIAEARKHLLNEYPLAITYADDHITMTNFGGKKVFLWADICRVTWSEHALHLATRNGRDVSLKHSSRIFDSSTWRRYEEFLDRWANSMATIEHPFCCEYDPTSQSHDRRKERAGWALLAVLALFATCIAVYYLWPGDTSLPAHSVIIGVLLAAAGVFFAYLAISRARSRVHVLTQALIEPDKVTLVYDDGSALTLKEGDIRSLERYRSTRYTIYMARHVRHSAIDFDLAGFDYSGLLRKHLLELIPDSTQMKSNDQRT